MPSKNELIFDIMNTAYGGDQSDDVKITERQVSYWIDQVRADLIEKKMKRGGELPESLIQCLECVDMEYHEEIDGCKVLRSVKDIPQTLGGNSANLITSVYAGEGSSCVFYSRTNYFRTRTNKFNKYTAKSPRWYFKKGKLYLTNASADIISIAGIFEDPKEVAKFCNADGGPCYSDDGDYPVTAAMSKDIASIILKERFDIVLQTEPDEQNNAQQTPRNDNS